MFSALESILAFNPALQAMSVEQPLDLPHSLLNQPLDEHGFTLLHVAARAGRAEAVCLLLEAGADPALRYGHRAYSS